MQIVFKEDLGLGGRGGYFDTFGIIRDIMQNQLLQVMMWIAMDPPEDMSAAKTIEAKVELLDASRRCAQTPKECFLGQFGPSKVQSRRQGVRGAGLPRRRHGAEGLALPDVCVAAAAGGQHALARRAVPDDGGQGPRRAAVRGAHPYKQKPHNKLIAAMSGKRLGANELVMRIQPDESLYMTEFMSKEPSLNTMAMPPGLKWVPKMTVMDMSYAEQFRNAYVGDAYERMFLNAALGDQSLFVSADELVEMWRIFTPLLHQIDEQKFPTWPSTRLGWCPTAGPMGEGTRRARRRRRGRSSSRCTRASVTWRSCASVFVELDVDKQGPPRGPRDPRAMHSDQLHHRPSDGTPSKAAAEAKLPRRRPPRRPKLC